MEICVQLFLSHEKVCTLDGQGTTKALCLHDILLLSRLETTSRGLAYRSVSQWRREKARRRKLEGVALCGGADSRENLRICTGIALLRRLPRWPGVDAGDDIVLGVPKRQKGQAGVAPAFGFPRPAAQTSSQCSPPHPPRRRAVAGERPLLRTRKVTGERPLLLTHV